MPATVSEFRSRFRSNPAKPAYFEAQIVPPAPLLGQFASALGGSDVLSYRASSAEIPGRIIQSLTATQEMGPIRKLANASIYNDVGVDFLITDKWSERNVFQTWQSWIINSDEDNPGAGDNHVVRWYDEYVGSVIITAFNQIMQPTYTVTLMEAWPSAVASVPLDWAAGEQHAKCRVEFSYRYFKTEQKGGSISTAVTSLASNLLGQIF